MKLKVLGSGSSGNCYILENRTEALIIEAGISFKEVKIALDFDISKIVGVIVSHEHSDHSKAVKEYEEAGIPVFRPYRSEMERQVGVFWGFVIKSFPLVHDVPCFGFVISHLECGKLVYISDTEYVKYRFKNLNHILVEANYSKDLLSESEEAVKKRNHVLAGHMEIGTACEFLRVNQNSDLRNVVLLHLSEDNADPEKFRNAAAKMVDCPVYIAKRGIEIDLNLCPF